MKPSERLNRSYTLRRTTVDLELDDGPISVPATVSLDLSPRPKVFIELEFAWADVQAANEINKKGQVIVRLKNGCSFCAIIGGTGQIGGGQIRLTLVPKSELVTVLDCNSKLSRCKFGLLNFPSIWSDRDVTRYPDPGNPERGFLYQRFQLRAEKWLVDIIAVDSVMAVHHHLLRRGGSALTHTGTVIRSDEQQFSLEELSDFLNILHLFLSFARGAYCGLTYLSGHDPERTRVWEQWGTYEVEPWQRELTSWIDPGASEELSYVFEGFWKLFKDPKQGEAISKISQWYLRSNESNETVVGVVLAHAALEHISFLLNGRKGKDQSEGEWMKDALEKIRIDPTLPGECGTLTDLNSKGRWSHGPHALTVIRNNLVHPDNRSGPFSEEALAEAQSLALYYIELTILSLSGYSGQFVNRLKGMDRISSKLKPK